MEWPEGVGEILGALVAGVREALGENLVGLYVKGSLATGDFDPETSDVDFFAVTEWPLSEGEYERLRRLHGRLAGSANRYGRELEGAYVYKEAARRYRPGERHPTAYRGEEFGWSEHMANWLLERKMVREQGVVLMGPEPGSLIDPVSAEEVREAVRARLRHWAEWVEGEEAEEWLPPLSHKAYVVETMCRALYALEAGELIAKPLAVAWAVERLPERWGSLAARARGEWKTDGRADAASTPEVSEFVRWAAKQAGEGMPL